MEIKDLSVERSYFKSFSLSLLILEHQLILICFILPHSTTHPHISNPKYPQVFSFNVIFVRQDEGPLQCPAGVGSSSETLSLGKAGLGGVALSTGESGRESPESDRSALTLSGSENSGGETGGMWAVVAPRAEETSAELETLLGLACRHPKSNPFS